MAQLVSLSLQEFLNIPHFVSGYRKVWSILRRLGIAVHRNTVMEIVRELDPEGVTARRKKRLRRRIYSVPGPDFLWHIDGYDKLKPYGFSVHGCIDGFSRRIIWLETGPSNKDPEIIAAYYISAVKNVNGVPSKIRSDDGSENSLIEPIQIALRSGHTDEFAGLASFAIGTSPSNQRIESLWSQFAKDRPMWWRHFFSELSSLGCFNSSSYVIKECLRFCFMHLLRSELNEFMERWNRHLIAKTKGASLPTGRPNSMYYLPQLYDAQSYKMPVDFAEVEEFEDPNFAQSRADISEEFSEFVETVLTIRGLSTNRPSNVKEALIMYFVLLEEIEAYS